MDVKEQTVPEATPVPVKKKKRGKWPIVLAVVVLLAAGAVLFFKNRAGTASAQATYVTEAVSARTIVRSLSGSGTLKPANSYTVTTLIEGEVLSADFEEGDVVEKDTVLYEVDSSDTANNIERAQISLEQAQRSYNTTAEKQYVRSPVAGTVVSLSVRAGDKVSQGQTVATVRDSSVMTLKVPFPSDDAAGFFVGQEATVTLDGSFETLSGTVKEISGAETVGAGNMLTRSVTVEVANPGALTDGQAASVSIGGVNGAGSASFTYRAEGTVTAGAAGTVRSIQVAEGGRVSRDQTILTLGGTELENQLQSAADSLRTAELSMSSSREQLESYTITSPISGTIVEKTYKKGDTVAAGKQLCIIYDLSYLEMTLNIDELDISAVSVGQDVTVTADAVEGKTYRGVVTRVSVAGTTTNGTTSYPVTIRLDETDGLLPGMNVDASIIVTEVDDALSVSNAAVNRGGLVLVTADSPSAANAVALEAPEGYAYVTVETGISDDDYVQIVSGLSEGDTVAYAKQTADSSPQMPMMVMGGFGGAPGGAPSGGGPSGGGSGGGRPSGAPAGGPF